MKSGPVDVVSKAGINTTASTSRSFASWRVRRYCGFEGLDGCSCGELTTGVQRRWYTEMTSWNARCKVPAFYDVSCPQCTHCLAGLVMQQLVTLGGLCVRKQLPTHVLQSPTHRMRNPQRHEGHRCSHFLTLAAIHGHTGALHTPSGYLYMYTLFMPSSLHLPDTNTTQCLGGAVR